MARVTYVMRVQWSEVHDLPLWLWLTYVASCKAILESEGTHG